MTEEQNIMIIDKDQLLEKVSAYSAQDYRLVQICCVKLPESIEMNYSFDKDSYLENLKIIIPNNDVEIPSVSGIYSAAFIYENEMHDLYGLKISNIALDYKGTFYKTSVKNPFNNIEKSE